jgi:predicted amidophosphoribosyltransferase
VGSARICHGCASSQIDSLEEHRCGVCQLPLDGPKWEPCGNPVCNRSTRGFDRIWAVSYDTGDLNRVIRRFKYDNDQNWAEILGRILAGFLDDNVVEFVDFDLIVPSPSFTGPGAHRDWDPVRAVFDVAVARAQGPWPFDVDSPRAVVQTAAVERFVGNNWARRREIAEGPLRQSLAVPNHARVKGKAILVYDDVFTDGLRAREVANALLSAGAARVSQIVLARAPFRRPGSA